MFMEDEKGLDSKVVTSPINRDGTPLFVPLGGRSQKNRHLFRAIQAA